MTPVRAILGRMRDWKARPPQRLNRSASLLDASVWAAPLAVAPRIAAAETRDPHGLDPEFVPILGEFAWHSLTVDSRLAAVSEEHYSVVSGLLAEAGMHRTQDLRILEIAAYAHTTGYML